MEVAIDSRTLNNKDYCLLNTELEEKADET